MAHTNRDKSALIQCRSNGPHPLRVLLQAGMEVHLPETHDGLGEGGALDGRRDESGGGVGPNSKNIRSTPHPTVTLCELFVLLWVVGKGSRLERMIVRVLYLQV